jgi:glycerol-3-phosphate dehydrogenase
MITPLTDRVYDVAIIGGGILGVSVARDCAMRRLSVVLFEMTDFASGTTGSGTGLLSGEPHWLSTNPETTQLACEEINVFQRIAPNLLSRVPLLYPFSKSVPKAELERFQSIADVYDRYAAAKGGRPHARLTANEMKQVDAGFSADVWGAITLDEWAVDPHRLTVATARSAAAAGATLVKGARVEGLEFQGARVSGLKVSLQSGVPVLVRSRTVVNAAGPWAPSLVSRKPVVNGVRFFQRSYLQFERRVTETALACLVPNRSEPLYLLPRENRSLIGPVEKAIPKMEVGRVEVTDSEVSLMLKTIEKFYPGIEHHRILSVSSGVHCRVSESVNREGKKQTIFDHSNEGAEGLFTVLGAGITRARRLAQEVSDLLCRKLRHKEKCRTHLESLPGCTSEIPWLEEAKRTGLNPLSVARLIRRYGHKAEGILDSSKHAELGQTLCECEQVLAAEVEYVVRNEWVTSLADLKRRTGLGTSTCRGCRCIAQSGRFLGSLLGWGSERLSQELKENPPDFPSCIRWGEQEKQKEYSDSLDAFGGHNVPVF